MPSRREIMLGGAAIALAGSAPGAIAQVVATARQGQRAISVLSDGSFEMPLSMLARDVALDAIVSGTGRTGPVTSVLNVTCFRQGDQVVVFDCGSGAHFLPGTGKLAASLEAAGIAPDSVTHVLFTHLHPDHFWGALDDFDTPLFPNARWLASRREIAFWSDPAIYQRLPEDRHAFAAGAQRIIKALGDTLEQHDPGSDWLPGVAAFDTAGHTPGHVSFELKDADGPVFVLGDALTHPVASFAHPEWRPASDFDADRAVATRRAVLERAAAEQAQVIGYHLDGGIGRVERAGTAYRFAPAR
ncbi:MBL fold metallo-hydrolase [Bosea sp. 124]|uniref:MBL fold metallo-hydrolase n=1 Tax=Bosea sp. 124 TaxID=2135642 RepID=UPI000D3B1315|nr:MBL fold metallo-hydrolase [Bosea sp. 124]PTM43476.1 glyoxylase-like metal-dependent hydrolase (beta-lactamase superfamily II) [Bosea sp. 124]